MVTVDIGCLSRKNKLSKGKVAVKGEKAPIVGEICMSQTMIDVTGMEDVAVGDEMEVIGPQIHAEEMA